MPKHSAGILLYRYTDSELQVFLVHPGGPFFKKKSDGVWSIPKGEFLDDEDALVAAKREFKEETSFDIDGSFLKLKPVKLKSGKIIYPWAVEGDIDHTKIVSNHFEIEWPPSSGKIQSFPEVDRGGWFSVSDAKAKIYPVQYPIIEELQALLDQ